MGVNLNHSFESERRGGQTSESKTLQVDFITTPTMLGQKKPNKWGLQNF